MKIAVIEDHKLVREMLVLTCANVMPGAEVRGAGTGAEGVALCRDFKPDVIFLDLALPDGDGLDLLEPISKACPQGKVIALTSHPDQFTIHRALRAKVHGFIDKNDQPLGVLKEAIVTVMEGRKFFSPVVQRVHLAMRKDSADFSKMLTDREVEMLALFGAGLTNEEVAKRVGCVEGTAKVHRYNIMNKLEIHSTSQLMRYALERGFTRVDSSTQTVG